MSDDVLRPHLPPKSHWALGPLQHPVRALLHGGSAVLALVLYTEVRRWPGLGPEPTFLLALFALSQAAMFGMSALFHAFDWGPAWWSRLQRLDHAMIYLGIAGALTPLTCLVLEGPWRFLALGASWGIAGAGAVQRLSMRDLPEYVAVPMQLFQGAIAAPIVWLFVTDIGGFEAALVGVAAASYALGAAAFLTGRPFLWPRVFSFHEVFHTLTVVGALAAGTAAVRLLAP